MSAGDGATYQAGDVLGAYIRPGSPEGDVAGYLDVADPMVNAGVIPAPFSPANGTPGVPGEAGWEIPAPGVERGVFDLVVICHGRNDKGFPPVEEEHLLNAMIAGAASLGPRVLVCTPPPLTEDDQSDWLEVDHYTNQQLLAAQRAAQRSGAFFFDAVAAFKDEVASGRAAIPDLMRDSSHPQGTEENRGGFGLYADAIASALAERYDRGLSGVGPAPSVRIGGEPVSGWSPRSRALSGHPSCDPFCLVAGSQPARTAIALVSNTRGDELVYRVRGRAVGVIVSAGESGDYIIAIDVDDHPTVEIPLTLPGFQDYPRGYAVALGLPDVEHNVVVRVVTGTARIFGVVGL
jgi:hypothetical protein